MIDGLRDSLPASQGWKIWFPASLSLEIAVSKLIDHPPEPPSKGETPLNSFNPLRNQRLFGL